MLIGVLLAAGSRFSETVTAYPILEPVKLKCNTFFGAFMRCRDRRFQVPLLHGEPVEGHGVKQTVTRRRGSGVIIDTIAVDGSGICRNPGYGRKGQSGGVMIFLYPKKSAGVKCRSQEAVYRDK
jgi:hypothetical protein